MTNPVDDLIATAQPRTEEVRICARGDLVEAHAEAVLELQTAIRADSSLAGSPDVTAAAERVKGIEDELESSTVVFRLQAVSRQKWANLLAEFPPSKEQLRAGNDHDPERFPIAAVAACIIEPAITTQQLQQLADRLPYGEWTKLWVAALTLNAMPNPSPKLPAATELLRANGRSSTTSENEASPEVGSLAGSGEQ